MLASSLGENGKAELEAGAQAGFANIDGTRRGRARSLKKKLETSESTGNSAEAVSNSEVPGHAIPLSGSMVYSTMGCRSAVRQCAGGIYLYRC